jgi:Cytosolic carboxypeptidase N-terminal domain
VRTYGRNEDHIYMVKVENDYEFWGDFADDEIRERNLLIGRPQKLLDDFYFFNYTKQTREFNCNFCHEKIDPDDNRFNEFLRNTDIINHTNHFDQISFPKRYENLDAAFPCWCNNMPQFSRSSIGGSKYLLSAQPYALDPDDLIFESRFESGNLARVVKVTQNYYELYLRPDMYTNRHTQWFYFRVKNTRTKTPYR